MNLTDLKEQNLKTNRPLEEQSKEFSELLDKLDIGEKKKSLWKQIYEHAIIDRQNSYILLEDLMAMTLTNSANHAVHGQTISKYIERMQKANDQILKLAELIAMSEVKVEEKLDPEKIFEQISSTAGVKNLNNPKKTKSY